MPGGRKRRTDRLFRARCGSCPRDRTATDRSRCGGTSGGGCVMKRTKPGPSRNALRIDSENRPGDAFDGPALDGACVTRLRRPCRVRQFGNSSRAPRMPVRSSRARTDRRAKRRRRCGMRGTPSKPLRKTQRGSGAEVPVLPGCREGSWRAAANEARLLSRDVMRHGTPPRGSGATTERNANPKRVLPGRACPGDSVRRIAGRRGLSALLRNPVVPNGCRPTWAQGSGRRRQEQVPASGASERRGSGRPEPVRGPTRTESAIMTARIPWTG